MIFTASEVRAYYTARIPHLKATNQREWRCPCPIHQGTRDSFAINAETGLAQCHSQCGRGFDVISFEMELSGLDFPKAKDRVFELVGRPKVPWEERDFDATYDYVDPEGKLLYQVVRKHGKQFVQRRPDGRGGWIWGLGDVKRVPFCLPKVLASDFVAVVEGEKDASTLNSLGIVATCNNGGAGNFKPELVPHFAGRRVAIFPDNDDPGREHAMKVAALLAPVAKSVKIVEIPDLAEKGDVTDFVNKGGTKAKLRELYQNAQEWTPEWQFSREIPSENDRFVRTFQQEIDSVGGLTEFWNLSRLVGLETPWKKLSRALGGGLRSGEVYVIGANQGAGKTSLALQFVIHTMRENCGPLVFSMEMLWKSLFQRMASIEARINLNEFQDAQLTLRNRHSSPEEREEAQKVVSAALPELCKHTSNLCQHPLLVSTKSSVTPEFIIAETKRLRSRQKIGLVVVDHMQLMSSTGKVRGDYEKFTAISRAMKQVAMELNVPVLIVSQTSRHQSKDHRWELEVSDLRGSGAIEEDAAAVMLLYEDKDDADAAKLGDGTRYTKGPVRCWMKLGKNRFGEQMRCFRFTHAKYCTRFDMEDA